MKRDIFMIQCPQAYVQEKVLSVRLDRGGKQLSEVDMKYRKRNFKRRDKKDGSARHPSLFEIN